MKATAETAAVRKKALDLLARREHSVQELRGKLMSRGFEADDVEPALAKLVAERLLSDERFAEAWVNYRRNAGFGPLRIRHELSQKGIGDELAERFLDSRDSGWHEKMVQLRVRRYGAEIPADYRERMKQARFLQNRGFSPEAVMRLFR